MTWVCEDPDVAGLVRRALAAADVLWNTGLVEDARMLDDAAGRIPVDDEEE